METWQKVLIIVGSSIAGIIVILILLSLIFVGTFKRHMDRHGKALSISLSTKKDIMATLVKLLDAQGITFNKNLLNTFSDITNNDFANVQSETFDKAKNILTSLSNEIIYAISKNKPLLESSEISICYETMMSQSNEYRYFLLYYNADVIGYNYWICFPTTAFIFKLLHKKRLNVIQ